MPKVWIVVGWFGDHEWIESVHATEDGASEASAVLWAHRHSDKEPEYLKGYGVGAVGLSKFGYEEYDLQP